MPDPLFFIAILPDQEIQEEVTAFKRECAAHFNASHALNSPPHITLIPPFRWPQDKLEVLKTPLMNFVLDQLTFSIKLKNFSCFRPSVLFVDVVKNDHLNQIQLDLDNFLQAKLKLKTKRGQEFHPHMTIAHRDLDEKVFPSAWNYFSKKNYERSFLAKEVSLLMHIGGKWQVVDVFALN